jgi:hypothetical protein
MSVARSETRREHDRPSHPIYHGPVPAGFGSNWRALDLELLSLILAISAGLLALLSTFRHLPAHLTRTFLRLLYYPPLLTPMDSGDDMDTSPPSTSSPTLDAKIAWHGMALPFPGAVGADGKHEVCYMDV